MNVASLRPAPSSAPSLDGLVAWRAPHAAAHEARQHLIENFAELDFEMSYHALGTDAHRLLREIFFDIWKAFLASFHFSDSPRYLGFAL